MADSKAIANRIKSVQDTRKITNAMYLISSTKLRKARRSLEETRPFFRALRSEITRIVEHTGIRDSKYFVHEDNDSRSPGTCGILVLTADKGLAGAYNQNVIKETLRLLEEYPDYRLFVVGEYGRHYFSSHHIPFDEPFDFTDIEPTLSLARMIAGYIMERYDRGELTQLHVIYTHFKNAMSSEVQNWRMLPFETSHFSRDNMTEPYETIEYEYFPSPAEVLQKCIPVYCIGLIYSALVYSFCCEQNDRMMAMDSANQNADKLIKELSLKYNHLRQNGITQEITEISASVKASHRS